MFNVGGPEVLVIALVALVVLGPQQLPKVMRTLGAVMSEIRKVSDGFQAEMRNAMDTMVDTSGSEKPQSGSMAGVTPSGAGSGPAPAATAEVQEVAARNDGPVDDPIPDGAGPVEDVPRARPAIDPADRAAG